jgi:hypothetical protein
MRSWRGWRGGGGIFGGLGLQPLMRGLEKVRAEFSLTALAYNLTRVFNILGVATLLQALKTA